MREILFRGKRKCNGEWLFGGFHSRFGRAFIIGCSKSFRIDGMEVIPETVSQYTGLKDKNGKRIFEGDVVICSLIGGDIYHPPYSWNRKQVVFERGAFCVEDLTGDTAPLHDYAPGFEIEVIGNIHDNPELLKGGGA